MDVAKDAVNPGEWVAGLKKTLKQWIAEHSDAQNQDPVRAQHIADAISDLRAMIARVEAESLAFAVRKRTRAIDRFE